MISKDEFSKRLAQRKARSAHSIEQRNAFYNAQKQRLEELHEQLQKLLDNVPKRCFFILPKEQFLELNIGAERVLGPSPDFFMKIHPSHRLRSEIDPPGYTFISEHGFHGLIKRSFGPWNKRVRGEPTSFSAHSNEHLLELVSEEMIGLMIALEGRQ